MSRGLDLEQPFRTDLEYFEARAEGIAMFREVSVDEARRDLARRHGYASWERLRRHVEALSTSKEPTSFMLAYRAVEDGNRDGLAQLLDRHSELVRVRGTNGNDLLGMADDLGLVRLLLEHAADPNRGNDYGWTKLHPVRVPRLARVDEDPYRGTPLTWAAFNGRTRAVRRLLELGADPNGRGTFGGADHGEGVTALHLAAQAGRRDTAEALLAAGADPSIRDELHDGPAWGWVGFGGHPSLADRLREMADGSP